MWSEDVSDFARGCRLNMVEGFNKGLGGGSGENIKSLKERRSVEGDVNHWVPHPPNPAILDTKPMLHKVQFQSVSAACRNRHYVMEVPKTMPFVKTTIGDFG